MKTMLAPTMDAKAVDDPRKIRPYNCGSISVKLETSATSLQLPWSRRRTAQPHSEAFGSVEISETTIETPERHCLAKRPRSDDWNRRYSQ